MRRRLGSTEDERAGERERPQIIGPFLEYSSRSPLSTPSGSPSGSSADTDKVFFFCFRGGRAGGQSSGVKQTSCCSTASKLRGQRCVEKPLTSTGHFLMDANQDRLFNCDFFCCCFYSNLKKKREKTGEIFIGRFCLCFSFANRFVYSLL